jgi:hypothetical protein
MRKLLDARAHCDWLENKRCCEALQSSSVSVLKACTIKLTVLALFIHGTLTQAT